MQQRHTDTQMMLLTNATPRHKSQYRIQQNIVSIEFHLARTTSPVPQQRKQVTYGGGHFYVAISFQRLFCCPSHNGIMVLSRENWTPSF